MAKFTIETSGGQYWWRLVAGNGQIVATSAERYVSKDHTRKMIDWVKANAPTAALVDNTGSRV